MLDVGGLTVCVGGGEGLRCQQMADEDCLLRSVCLEDSARAWGGVALAYPALDLGTFGHADAGLVSTAAG